MWRTVCRAGAFFVFCLTLSACGVFASSQVSKPLIQIAQPTPASSQENDAPDPPDASPSVLPSATPTQTPALQHGATLLAVGDIMVHSPQLPAYYSAASKTYDVRPWFHEVKPLLQQGDWVVGNLETPIAGADLKYSGYPRFNAPADLLAALKDAGFNLLGTANNHAMDRGYPGVVRTLGNIRKSGLIPFGTSADPADAKRNVIVERNGIKLGFLAYTFGTNGIPLPKDKPYAVNFISLSAITADIKRLRAAGADAVSVSLHFGIEYQKMPNDEQRKIARAVIEAGADIVLGSHPHVVQPYETMQVRDPQAPGGTRRGLVVYSMGNFISSQSGEWKDVGVIMSIRLTKTIKQNGAAVTSWSDVTATPTWVHQWIRNHKRYYTIVPMRQTLDRHDDPALQAKDYDKIRTLLAGITSHLKLLTP